jgi:hypothetical protein
MKFKLLDVFFAKLLRRIFCSLQLLRGGLKRNKIMIII